MPSTETPAVALLRAMLEEIGQPCDPDADPTTLTVEALRLDSLSVLELLMLIEERTGVEIPVEDIEATTTLADIASRISPPPAG